MTLLPFLPGPSKQRSIDAFHHSFLRPRIANSTPILVSIASLSTRYSKRRPGRLALSLGAVRRSSFEQCGESVWDFARCSVGRTACRRCGRAGCANGSARPALQIGLGGNLIHPLPRAVDRRVNITQVLQRPLKCFVRLTETHPWARSKNAKKAFVECITACLTIAKTGKISQLNQYVINWRRGWDSNPRYSREYNGFRDRPVRPLRHPSARHRPDPCRGARGRPVRSRREPTLKAPAPASCAPASGALYSAGGSAL